MSAPALHLYWKEPLPSKGVAHPGCHLLAKGYLGHVMGLDEPSHCRMVSRLLQRPVSSIARLSDLTQEEWTTLAAAQKECRRALRANRSMEGARRELRRRNPHWID